MRLLDKLVGFRKPPLEQIDEMVKGWKEHERLDYGFKISYPFDWVVKYTDQGVEIYPRDNPHAFDSLLGRDVASPGINIIEIIGYDPNQNMVKKFVQTRPRGYERYKLIKRYSHKLRNAKYMAVYEFQYGTQDSLFSVLSLVAQRNSHMFVVTASGALQDFNSYRKLIEGIVFSFQLI